ncbi:MAG: cytochrome C oxidase subunit IV family protein [Zetaproteobacteria bacterium]|nr:cytochrome C oxidase subunit IV family protein [Zetaproteobacteria bacterium]
MVGQDSNHASVRTYWNLAGILCVITFIEWVIFKIEDLRTWSAFMLPTLIALSLAKLIMVCGWYMHLKYDHKLLTYVFGFSVFLTMMTFTILMLALR